MIPHLNRMMGRSLLLAIFLLSGVAGLGYQIAWVRLFSTALGHEMPSMLAVVGAFFGGLALGAWLLDRRVSQTHWPLRTYAILELLIAAWALISINIIDPFNHFALELIGLEHEPVRQWSVAFVMVLLALLPATAAMGATLPVMDRALSMMTRQKRVIGALYAANTLGAMVGTLLSAFWLIASYGLQVTVYVLASLNLFCALSAWLLQRDGRVESGQKQRVAGTGATRPPWRALFFTGLLGVGYEVVVVRILAQMMENTVFSFASALAVYLLGTAIGAALYQRYWSQGEFERVLARLLSTLSVACIAGVLCLQEFWPAFDPSVAVIGMVATELLAAALVFGLPTLIMGATFSHLAQAARGPNSGIGHALALNTLGAMSAPLAFGVLLLPILGSLWTLVLISLAYLFLVPSSGGISWPVRLTLPCALLVFAPPHLRLLELPRNSQIVTYRDGVAASVAVIQDESGNRSLRVNNHFQMGSTRQFKAERRQALLPLLLHPKPAQALFLGVGTGMTLGAASLEPDLKADAVELLPEVVVALPEFSPENLSPSTSDNIKLYVADARRFVRVSEKRYDVIIADLFHPAREGAGALYTREHFTAVQNRMADDAIFCQWLPLYQLDEPMLRVIVGTFLSVFEHTSAFLSGVGIDSPALALCASQQPLSFSPDWYTTRVNDPRLAEVLKLIRLGDEYQLFGSFVANAAGLRQYSDGAPINTDNHPIVVFGAPAIYYDADTSAQPEYLLMRQILDRVDGDPTSLIADGHPDSRSMLLRLNAYLAAREIYLRALVAEAEGVPRAGLDGLIEAAETSADFSLAFEVGAALAQTLSSKDPVAAKQLREALMRSRNRFVEGL